MWWCCRRISTIVTNQFVGIEGVELGSADKVSASIWFWSAIVVVGNLYLDQPLCVVCIRVCIGTMSLVDTFSHENSNYYYLIVEWYVSIKLIEMDEEG